MHCRPSRLCHTRCLGRVVGTLSRAETRKRVVTMQARVGRRLRAQLEQPTPNVIKEIAHVLAQRAHRRMRIAPNLFSSNVVSNRWRE